MSFVLAAAAAPSVIKGIAGIADIFGGKRRARNNIRPTAEVNQNYLKNVALAESMGRTGLPQEQYNRSFQNIGRNQSVALNSLSRSANPAAGLQGLLRASNDATMGLDVQSGNARLNNQRFAFGQRNNLAQDQQRVFNWNKIGRYNEEANAAAQQIGSGKSNAFGALSDLSQLGQVAAGAGVFGGGGGQGSFNQPGTNGYINNYLPNASMNTPSQYGVPANRFYNKFKF